MSDIRIDTVYDNYGLKKRKPLVRKSFKGIYVYQDLVGKVEDFKVKNGVELEQAIKDVIKYLKLRNLRNKYTLIFNGVNLVVSVDCDINLAKNKYNRVLENRKIEEVSIN